MHLLPIRNDSELVPELLDILEGFPFHFCILEIDEQNGFSLYPKREEKEREQESEKKPVRSPHWADLVGLVSECQTRCSETDNASEEPFRCPYSE